MVEDKFIVVMPDETVWGSTERWTGYLQIMDKEVAEKLSKFHNECGIKSKVAKLDFNLN